MSLLRLIFDSIFRTLLRISSFRNFILRVSHLMPGADKYLSHMAANELASRAMHPRPHAYSLWSPEKKGPNVSPSNYLTWHSVTDSSFFDLHLQPADESYINSLPSNTPTDEHPFGQVTSLFQRQGEMKGGGSSVFFMFFAQWFSDGFFRSSFHNGRKTSSTHNIDLSQIYGANEQIEYLLRSLEGGKLNSQIVDGEELPDSLGQIGADGKWEVKEKYESLPYIKDKVVMEKIFGNISEEKRQFLYATGLERGNNILGNVCFSTLFLREHNNICEELAENYPDWDDDRLYHTARIINSVILIKIVLEEYINHIAGQDILRFDTSFAEKEKWYRRPWMAAEFNLLYRFHGLIPDHLQISGKDEDFVRNYSLLSNEGLASIFEAASQQQAGVLGLHNVPAFMSPVEKIMIDKGRDWRLRSFNDYRVEFGKERFTSFSQFTKDEAIQQELQSLYGHPDNVEFTVGLFAEDSIGKTLTGAGSLQLSMVAYDAITQIYTNPLLTKHNFTEKNYTKVGMNRINETNTLQILVDRNINQKPKVTFKYKS